MTTTIPADDIARAVVDVAIARDTTKTRPTLSGVSVRQRDERIRVCATDGKVLIEQLLPLGSRHIPDTILPFDHDLARMVKRVDKLNGSTRNKPSQRVELFLEIDDEDGVIRWVASDGQSTVWQRRLLGKFPAYEKYLDERNDTACKAVGLSSVYMAMINKLSSKMSSTWVWRFSGDRAMIGEPWDNGIRDREVRVLIMSVTLPDGSDKRIPAVLFDKSVGVGGLTDV